MPGVRWGAYRARFYTRPGAHSMPRTGKKKPTSCIATSWATLAGPPSGESVRPAKNSGRGKKVLTLTNACVVPDLACSLYHPAERSTVQTTGCKVQQRRTFCALHLCGQHHKGASAAARALEENPGQKKACDPWGRQASILDSKNWYWRVLRQDTFNFRANFLNP
jgi:hypothetical protein